MRKRRRRAATRPAAPVAPVQPADHQCQYREVLEHLIGWLYERHATGNMSIRPTAVLRIIGAAEPDQRADPLTGCLPVTAEGPAAGGAAGP